MVERALQSDRLSSYLVSIFAVGFLGSCALLFVAPTIGEAFAVDKANNSTDAMLMACWKEEGMPQYVPTTLPTPSPVPMRETQQSSVETNREQQIQSTQSAFQNMEEREGMFAPMGEEYMRAIVRYELVFPVSDEPNAQRVPVSLGSALMVEAQYVQDPVSGERAPIWIFLSNNHVINNDIKTIMESGGNVGFDFRGIDTDYGTVSHFPVTASLIGCRDIISGDQHVGTLLAVRGGPGMTLQGRPNVFPAEEYFPFPPERVGGPCGLGEEGMKMVSFPSDGNGQFQPLLSEIYGPYGFSRGMDSNGVVNTVLIGNGLVNGGSSGGSLLDEESGRVCGIVNYKYGLDSTLVGFNVLPNQEFMQQEIQNLLSQHTGN